MDFFDYKNGVYHAEDVSIAEIANAVGTPFYCYSKTTLERHAEVMKQAFKGKTMQICFAVKANCNLAVLSTFAKLGIGADVVSEGEIRLSLAAGIPANKIVFSGVGKTASEIAYALEVGVFQFNAESEPEVLLISQVAQKLGKKAPLALRVNPDVAAKTHAKISTGHKESKFGISFADARELYKKALTLPGISVQGISVHIGSQLTSLVPFSEAFARLAEFVKELKSAAIPIKNIDIGGGLGVPYEEGKNPPLPADYASVVLDALEGIDCDLVCEPGRLLVGNAGILVAEVIYTKIAGEKKLLVVNAGMNDLIRPAMYEAHHDIVAVNEPKDELVVQDVVGPVCESSDVFGEARELPEMQPGDLIAFRTAGAYGAVMSGTYNARMLVPEVFVSGDKFAVTRKRQTYDEFISEYKIPDWV